MKLNYKITEKEYQEVLEYQMTLQKNKLSQIARYFGLNLIFGGLAVYFLISRGHYSLFIRITPLIMALIVCLLSSYLRYCIPHRAGKALKSYVKSGTIQKGYLGNHTLWIENGKVKVHFGSAWNEIGCEEVGRIEQLTSITLMIAKGVIFEIIPNEILDANNQRDEFVCKLKKSCKDKPVSIARTSLLDFKEKLTMETTWRARTQTYLSGIVKGHRMFYSTISAWRGRQLVSLMILLYGMGVLALGLNFYLGLAFTLIGVLINRQLILAFTPIAYSIARQQLVQINGFDEEIGQETLYLTSDELIIVCSGQIQRAKLESIKAIRKSREHAFIYTEDCQMFVIPRDIFETKISLQSIKEAL